MLNQTLDPYFVDSINRLLFVSLSNTFHLDILYSLVSLEYTESIYFASGFKLDYLYMREVLFFQYLLNWTSSGFNSKQYALDLSPLAITHPKNSYFKRKFLVFDGWYQNAVCLITNWIGGNELLCIVFFMSLLVWLLNSRVFITLNYNILVTANIEIHVDLGVSFICSCWFEIFKVG